MEGRIHPICLHTEFCPLPRDAESLHCPFALPLRSHHGTQSPDAFGISIARWSKQQDQAQRKQPTHGCPEVPSRASPEPSVLNVAGGLELCRNPGGPVWSIPRVQACEISQALRSVFTCFYQLPPRKPVYVRCWLHSFSCKRPISA